MEAQLRTETEGTNCIDCERYKNLGEVCVLEHGKKFLWEYCKDFQQEVKLPDYNELMKSIQKDMAIERKKIRDKRKKEVVKRRKEREEKKREKLKLKRSKIAKKVWEQRRAKEQQQALLSKKKKNDQIPKSRTPNHNTKRRAD